MVQWYMCPAVISFRQKSSSFLNCISAFLFLFWVVVSVCVGWGVGGGGGVCGVGGGVSVPYII